MNSGARDKKNTQKIRTLKVLTEVAHAVWTQFTRRVGRDKLTLEDAKAYVQKRLESYLEWAIVYHECDPTDQDDLDDFNEDLESTFDDEDMVYGYYPFSGDKNFLEFHIKEVEMFNE